MLKLSSRSFLQTFKSWRNKSITVFNSLKKPIRIDSIPWKSSFLQIKRQVWTQKMAEEKIKLLELLSACIDVGIKAGNLIKEVKKSGKVEIDYKGKNDPVTNADVQAQKLINSSLIFKLEFFFF